MKYLLHTTTMVMRRGLLETEGRPFIKKEINIDDFLAPTVAIDEDGGFLYWVDYLPMLKTLEEFDAGITDPEQTTYYKHWAEKKGEEATKNRASGFYDTYQWIKEAGLKIPVAVECTGQKLDGSHRAAIMKHLGHTTIPAHEYQLLPGEHDEGFFKRTAKAREMLFGRNYYLIDYGGFTNLEGDVPEVYRENAEKWETLQDILDLSGQETIVDIGCNEGLMSIYASMHGCKVIGIDHEFIEGANFNNLALGGRATFVEEDVTEIILPEHDITLLLCVIYHIPKDRQVKFLQGLRSKSKKLVFQCNLRKAHEVERFRGCTVESLKELLDESGWKVDKVVEWKDKPFVVAI